MKIAIVIPVFVTGGAENMATQLAVHLRKAGADVEMISMYPRQDHPFEEKLSAAGVPVHYMDKQGHASVGAMLRLWKTLNRIRPDVVHTHIYAGFYTIPWVMTHRAVQLHTIHTHPAEEFPNVLRRFMYLCSKTGKLHYATISRQNQALCCACYHCPETVFPYVNNPVELERFCHHRREDGLVRFISVGRLVPAKNQSLALRALPRVLESVPGARLVLLGDGPERDALTREAEELGIAGKVTFAGIQTKPEDFLCDTDVYLLTSHVEGLPLSVLEGMAAGLPVLGTDVGGMSDIVQGNGVLIPDGDLDALVREMIRFARDPALRERFGQISKELVKAYSADACAEGYLAIYRKIKRS